MASRLLRTLAWAIVNVAASVTAPAQAQQHDSQLWFQANTNVPLADHVRVTLEQIARTSDRQEGLYQTEFGALLGFRILKGVELGVGYRKVGAHNGNTAGNEDRLRQQVVATVGPVVSGCASTSASTARERGRLPGPAAGPLQSPVGRKGLWRCSSATRASTCPTPPTLGAASRL